MRSFALASAFVVFIGSSHRIAHADVGWEGQLALRWPNMHYDEGMSWGFGLGARAGVTFGRLAVMLDYTDTNASAPSGWTPPTVAALGVVSPSTKASSSSGTLFRIGALARYTVRTRMEKTGLLARAWILGGVGQELVLWDIGGRLSRPDVAIGFGGAFGGIGKRRFGDSYFEIQMWIAPRTRAGATACGGPCDVATPPPPFDRSVVIDWGISFGR